MAQLEHRAAITQQVLHNGIADERFHQAADYNFNTHALVDKLYEYNHDQNQEMMAKLGMLHGHPYHETSHTNLDIGPAIPNQLPFHHNGATDGINSGYSFQSYSHTIPFHHNLPGATNSYEYHNEIPPFQHSIGSEVTPGYNLNEYGDVPGYPQQSGPDHVDHQAALHEQLHNAEVMMHAEMHDPVNAVNEEPVEEAGNGHSDVPTPPRLHSPNILRDIDFNGADPVSIADRATYSLSPLATQIANAATQSTASHLASRFSAMDDKLMNLVNRPHLFEGDPKAAMGEVRSHKHHHLKYYIKRHHGRSPNDNVQSGSARFHVPQYYKAFHRFHPYQNLNDYDPRKDTVFDKTISANKDTHATDFIQADNEASYQNDKHFGDMIDLAKKLNIITNSNVTNSTVDDNEQLTTEASNNTNINLQNSSHILEKTNSSQPMNDNDGTGAMNHNNTSTENPDARETRISPKENDALSTKNITSTVEDQHNAGSTLASYTGSSNMNQTDVENKEDEEEEEANSSSSDETEVPSVNKTTEPTRRHFEAITEKLNETMEFEVIEADQPTVKTKTAQHPSLPSPTKTSQIPSSKRRLSIGFMAAHNTFKSPSSSGFLAPNTYNLQSTSGFVAPNSYNSPLSNNNNNNPKTSPYSNKRTEIISNNDDEVKSFKNTLSEIDTVIDVLKHKPTMTRSTITSKTNNKHKSRKNTTLNTDDSVSIKDIVLTDIAGNSTTDISSSSTKANDTQALNSHNDDNAPSTNDTLNLHGFKLPSRDGVDNKLTDIFEEKDDGDFKDSKEQKTVVESIQGGQANKTSNAVTMSNSSKTTADELQSRTHQKVTPTKLAAVSKKDDKKNMEPLNNSSKDSISVDKNNKVRYHFNGRDHSISLDIQKKYLNYKNMVKRLREQSKSITSLGPIEPSSLSVSLKSDLLGNKSVGIVKPEIQHTNSDTRSKYKGNATGKTTGIIGASAAGKKFPANPVPASNNTALFDDSQADVPEMTSSASSTNSNAKNTNHGNNKYENKHDESKKTELKAIASSFTSRGNSSISNPSTSFASTNKTLKHSSTSPIGSPIQQEMDDLKKEIKLRYVKYKKLRRKFHNQTKSSIKIQPSTPSAEDEEEKMMVNSSLTVDSIIKEQSKATTGLSGNFTLVDSNDVKKFVGKPNAAPIMMNNTIGSVFDDNGNFEKRTILNTSI